MAQRPLSEIVDRLERRRSEIEQAIWDRLRSLAPSPEEQDVDYRQGLTAAVRAGLDYSVRNIARGSEGMEPVPTAALHQAELAARSGVSMETVLRRCTAADRVLFEFALECAASEERATRRDMERILAFSIDHLMQAVGDAYRQEGIRLRQSPSARQGEQIRKILRGEIDWDSAIGYDPSGSNIGIIATGGDRSGLLRSAARELGCQAIIVSGTGNSMWAWLGRRRRLSSGDVEATFAAYPERIGLALGEPRTGIAGWRRTHREAEAAYDVLSRGPVRVVCYSDVTLTAAALRDPELAESLLETFLRPLDDDGGASADDLRKTVQAYFASGHNARAAASLLKVERRTVKRRLRIVEERLGRRVDLCHAEIQVAMDVERLVENPRPRVDSETSQALSTLEESRDR